jgi:hypothetical protein
MGGNAGSPPRRFESRARRTGGEHAFTVTAGQLFVLHVTVWTYVQLNPRACGRTFGRQQTE